MASKFAKVQMTEAKKIKDRIATMKHKLLPYFDEEKIAILKNLKYTEESLKEDVDAIMDWFQKQPHLAEAGIDPDAIRIFLFMNKGSREKTKKKIDNYYKYRGLAPDMIQSRIDALSSCQDLWRAFRHAAMSRLYDGRRVTVVQFMNPDPNSFSTEEMFRNFYMITDIRLKYDYFKGEIWVVDVKIATFSHLLRLTPMAVQKGAQIFQEGLGFRVHAIHVLNFPSYGNQFINIFRKFVTPKIMDRLIIHSSLEELQKVLPKAYLPKDYGGEDYSMQEFKDMYEKEVRSEPTKQFLLDACKQVSDEKKRPGNDFDEEFMAGTFKKLDID